MTRSIAAALTLPLAAFLLAACDDPEIDRSPMATQTREVDDFDSIEMEGAARIEVTIGPKESVVVEAREQLIDRVKTEVHGDTLYIRSKPKDWFIANGRPRVIVRVTTPELESLKLEGGNDVRLMGFEGGETRIRAEGAAHIKGKGRLDELTVHMAGAGHADFTDLIADEATVTVDGVGSVYVHPKESLDATMNGVGAILYIGSPREVNTRMNGLGTIGQRKAGELDSEEEFDESEQVERPDRKDEKPTDEPIDPDKLQPEYEEPQKKQQVSETEVV